MPIPRLSPMPTAPSPIQLLHDLPRVTIRQRSVSEMDNNVYLITSKTSGVQVLIDAADDAPAIREPVSYTHLTLPTILLV